jgi:hypothetical protein
VTEPLTLSFDVACSVEHAFTTWTTRIATWWPSDHTVSGGEVVLEPGPGGRIFERSTDGTEYDWGRITVWEPPSVLGYSWHLGREAEHATDVEIRFVPGEGASTRVEIEHRGWEALGETAGLWRDRNQIGWNSLIPHYTRGAQA